MKKKILKIVCFLLTVVMLQCCAVSVFAEGKVSENITWKQEGSVLAFTGAGDMVLEYEYITQIPWYNLRAEIDTIVVGEGITSIDEGAFTAFRRLKEVSLPETLSVIGASAFLSCEGLESITLPDRVIKIEGGAFVGCENLKVIKK